MGQRWSSVLLSYLPVSVHQSRGFAQWSTMCGYSGVELDLLVVKICGVWVLPGLD